MRRLLILAVLLASPAAAQTAGDRYGADPGAIAGPPGRNPVAQRYSGRVLTWSGKVVAAPASAPAAPGRGVASQNPAPVAFRPQAPYAAPAPARQAQAAPPPSAAPATRPTPAALTPVRTAAQTPTQTSARAAPLPTSLYGDRGPVLAGGPPPRAGTEARLYSLHREYGLQPDAIPEPPAGQRYVLMGPPEPAAAPKDSHDAQAPGGGLADAPF